MIEHFKKNTINLASDRLGAEAIFATDDFFADKQRLLSDADPVFIDGKFDEHGKWMDGWESRRKRIAGHDYCIIKLARSGFIHGVVIDTSHFTGNYPPEVSLEGCYSETPPNEQSEWQSILDKSAINGNDIKAFEVDGSNLYTHVRFHIYPDGGVARLRLYGTPQCNWEDVPEDRLMDLGEALNGGRAVACSDEHFGIMGNLLLPDKGINMGDGWETARRRGPGYDWVIIALGHPGMLQKIIVDTAYFKGNYPDTCTIQGALLNDSIDNIEEASEQWPVLLPKSKLEMDCEHVFSDALNSASPVSHIRLNIYPDGGVSRLRLIGTIIKS